MPEVLTENKKTVTIRFRRWRKIGTDSVIQLPQAKGSPGDEWEELPIEDPERARLEREVINAAKADLMAETRQEGDNGIDRLIAARRAYRAAVLALIEFESSQQQIKK